MDYISYLDEGAQRQNDAEKERLLLERQALVDAMFNVMQTAEGRLLVRHIIQNSGAFVAQYCQTLSMAQYREGRRSLGMDVLKLCQDSGTADKLLQQSEA